MWRKSYLVALAAATVAAFASGCSTVRPHQDDALPPPVQKLVRAECIQLVDGSGKTRAEMTFTDAGEPKLIMYSRDGHERFCVELRGSDGVPVLCLVDDRNVVRAKLLVSEGISPKAGLWLGGGGGANKAMMNLVVPEKGDPPKITSRGADAKPVWPIRGFEPTKQIEEKASEE